MAGFFVDISTYLAQCVAEDVDAHGDALLQVFVAPLLDGQQDALAAVDLAEQEDDVAALRDRVQHLLIIRQNKTGSLIIYFNV